MKGMILNAYEQKKVTALLAMSLLSFGLITSNGSDIVSADDPNIVTTYAKVTTAHNVCPYLTH
ncbi:hypothetical protein AB4027_11480 [Alkalibacterium putridalgicola]|uniref:hypothetical protein n=1 Tax=Alkalibacterium putridalgicola TaxID=426703 RepID=UPI0034CF4FE8